MLERAPPVPAGLIGVAPDVARNQVKLAAVQCSKKLSPAPRISDIVLYHPVAIVTCVRMEKIEQGEVGMTDHALIAKPRIRQRKELILIEQVMSRISGRNCIGAGSAPVEHDPDVGVQLKQALKLLLELGRPDVGEPENSRAVCQRTLSAAAFPLRIAWSMLKYSHSPKRPRLSMPASVK